MAVAGKQPIDVLHCRTMTVFSRWLQKQRLSSERLASITGYSPAAVRSWRRGARRPSSGAVLAIALAFGMSATDGPLLIRRLLDAG